MNHHSDRSVRACFLAPEITYGRESGLREVHLHCQGKKKGEGGFLVPINCRRRRRRRHCNGHKLWFMVCVNFKWVAEPSGYLVCKRRPFGRLQA